MAFIAMDIDTIMMGIGPVSSVLVLKPKDQRGPHANARLPIQIGVAEAGALGMGLSSFTGVQYTERPMTHDLLNNVIEQLGGRLESVEIIQVKGQIFYARLNMVSLRGEPLHIDARPSDAVALALRAKIAVYVDENVLNTASYPDFGTAEQEGRAADFEEFRSFVEGLTPEDFASGAES